MVLRPEIKISDGTKIFIVSCVTYGRTYIQTDFSKVDVLANFTLRIPLYEYD